ncbi:S49 family peptidase [Chlamydia pecorum]|uniref:Clp protease family protein n=1 Tax=Chlamydia pecorum TaxID=85991 RepID=A0AA40U644_9CHLA|nr:S49 family peptidase [Chlamydia pecorum]AGW37636.1 putative exported protease [Chlamydia pecorum PV3056/3]ETF40494.1 proteinase IV [Chlamydia pecorum IPTaLE]KTF29189.1 clp protease family protein [Chlamydia pecorum]KZN27596.1 clp protease family protein [Chlamydia pecorum]KZN28256.1 clp protease family protein [Chlamydia pecorum]
MKILWRCFSKAFFSIIGLSLGVVLAFMLLLGLVASVANFSPTSFVNLPDAQGVVRELGKTAPIIVVLDIKDSITSAKSSAKSLEEALLALEKEPFKDRVKGVILDMNCPGGEVFEVSRIYATLNFWKQKSSLPLYVFVNGLCASGGYYIACTADKIYTSPASLIGSVGVLSGPYFNVKEGLNRHGIESDVLTAGEEKAPLNPYTPWTAQARKERQGVIDFLYGQFVDVVASHRPLLTKDKLERTLGARIFPPQQALEEGFVDVINVTKQHVLQELVTACGIEESYRVVGIEGGGLWKKIATAAASSPLITGKLTWSVSSEEHAREIAYF